MRQAVQVVGDMCADADRQAHPHPPPHLPNRPPPTPPPPTAPPPPLTTPLWT